MIETSKIRSLTRNDLYQLDAYLRGKRTTTKEASMKYVGKTATYCGKTCLVARAFQAQSYAHNRAPMGVLLTIVVADREENHECYNDARFGTAHKSVSLMEGPPDLPPGSYFNVSLSEVTFTDGQPAADAPEPERHACTCDIARLMRFGCTCSGI